MNKQLSNTTLKSGYPRLSAATSPHVERLKVFVEFSESESKALLSAARGRGFIDAEAYVYWATIRALAEE